MSSASRAACSRMRSTPAWARARSCARAAIRPSHVDGSGWGRQPDPSTWEGRMAARAQERARAQAGVERIREQAAREAEDIEQAAEEAAEYFAGPPDGCGACYVWS